MLCDLKFRFALPLFLQPFPPNIILTFRSPKVCRSPHYHFFYTCLPHVIDFDRNLWENSFSSIFLDGEVKKKSKRITGRSDAAFSQLFDELKIASAQDRLILLIPRALKVTKNCVEVEKRKRKNIVHRCVRKNES